MTTISRHDMTAHVASGRAQRWTQPLGPDQVMPEAARLDGTWYVVPRNGDSYQPAPDQLAAVLTSALAALELADATIARVGADTTQRDAARPS